MAGGLRDGAELSRAGGARGGARARCRSGRPGFSRLTWHSSSCCTDDPGSSCRYRPPCWGPGCAGHGPCQTQAAPQRGGCRGAGRRRGVQLGGAAVRGQRCPSSTRSRLCWGPPQVLPGLPLPALPRPVLHGPAGATERGAAAATDRRGVCTVPPRREGEPELERPAREEAGERASVPRTLAPSAPRSPAPPSPWAIATAASKAQASAGLSDPSLFQSPGHTAPLRAAHNSEKSKEALRPTPPSAFPRPLAVAPPLHPLPAAGGQPAAAAGPRLLRSVCTAHRRALAGKPGCASRVGCVLSSEARGRNIGSHGCLILLRGLESSERDLEFDASDVPKHSFVGLLQAAGEEPQGGLADACTSVLAALGSRNPGMIIDMLLYESEDNTLPLRSLLVAVGDLSLRPVLSGLATSAQDLLDMASPEDPVMDKTSD
ncbi:uncharacterized protein LOC105880150 [Microcebus murinus]|uniref:uncharacterized protein LOC105880150 n=1 Tax=Microcebus murinus TaxID=30608 RepID=UPI003F6C50B8